MFKRYPHTKRGKGSGVGCFPTSWWQRRRYVAVHVEEMNQHTDEPQPKDLKTNVQNPIDYNYDVAPQIKKKPDRYLPQRFLRGGGHVHCQFQVPRTLTKGDSFASIESLDSLVDSYWDTEDNESQSTALVSNTLKHGSHSGDQHFQRLDVLSQHLSFLTANIQPREVEIVYHNE